MMPFMDRGRWVKHRRCKRCDVARQAHYLTFSCWRGLALLNADRTRKWLAGCIAAARQVLPFELWAWVFMPEHVHMLVPIASGRPVADTTGTSGRPSTCMREFATFTRIPFAWQEGADEPLRIDRASLPPLER